jgi:hypothetical protein
MILRSMSQISFVQRQSLRTPHWLAHLLDKTLRNNLLTFLLAFP